MEKWRKFEKLATLSSNKGWPKWIKSKNGQRKFVYQNSWIKIIVAKDALLWRKDSDIVSTVYTLLRVTYK